MDKIIISMLVGICFLTGCSTSLPRGGETPEKAVAVAQCLSDEGVEMYGAFWCPHCADQKKIFGKEAEPLMPYFECDPRGDNSVTDTCLELNIERYPTWIFADGSRETGALPLTELQELSGCTDEALGL